MVPVSQCYPVQVLDSVICPRSCAFKSSSRHFPPAQVSFAVPVEPFWLTLISKQSPAAQSECELHLELATQLFSYTLA